MATKDQLRRAYVDLLMTTEQLSGLDVLLREADGFDMRRYEGDERLRTLESARNVLLEEEEDRVEGLAAALSPSDRLRAFAALVHHDRTTPGFGIPDEDLHRVTAGHIANDDPTVESDPLIETLGLVSAGVAEHGTFDLETVVARMQPEQHERLVRHLGERVVHSVTRGCDVETIQVPDGGGNAIRIWARYTSDQPVSDFVAPSDPLNWPKCNAFFTAMDLVQGTRTNLGAGGVGDPDHSGYRADVEEIVDFGYMSVHTFLQVVHYTREGESNRTDVPPGPRAVVTGMTFDLSDLQENNQEAKIDVDYGYLTVEEIDQNRSLVTSSKTLRFAPAAGEGGEWAMTGGQWACRLGWLDTMEQMNRCKP